ncbi:hypothetical protein G9A89_003383 [Geosiphon pyriformis]|nr:hypothetical protein G9A89_003383 [Geosiphon pyriformis]
MSKKKALKSAFYGSADGSFSQKKKVVLGNVKHFGDEKDIFLNKSGPSDNIYSNIESLSDDDKNINMSGVNSGSLLDSAATTPKTNFLLDSPNFCMDDDNVIIKTLVEVSIKKLFALDINFSAMEEKSATAKTQLIRKIFSTAVVIKKILIDTPKKMIIAAVSKFGDIKSIKVQLIGMWQKVVVKFVDLDQTEQLAFRWFFLIGKDSVCVTMAASRDWFRAFLFTLLVKTTAHNFDTLLDRAGGRTYVINCSVKTGNRIYCAVVGFEFEENLESAYCIEPIFDDCKHCEKFGHSALECDITIFLLSNCSNYLKKLLWRKFAFMVLTALTFYDHSTGAGSGLFPSYFSLDTCLLSLECSLEFLSDQVSDIVKWLNASVFQSSISVFSTAVDSSVDLDMTLNVFDTCLASSSFVAGDALVFSLCSLRVLTSKIGSFESKLVALEASVSSVLVKLDLLCASSGINVSAKQKDVVCWHKESGNMIMNKFKKVQNFFSGLNKGFLGTGVAIIMNNFLVCHAFKVEEVPGRFISVWLFFKDKLSVTFLGLYAGTFAEVKFGLALEINSFIAKMINSSSFVVLNGDFNKNGSKKSANYKFCLDIGLGNFKGTLKVIDFIFVSSNLAFAVALHVVNDVSEFFNTDHKSISVSIDLNGLLDTYLNSKLSLAGLLTNSNGFQDVKNNSNLDPIWEKLRNTIVHAADVVFFRHWFNLLESDQLVKIWSAVDNRKASKFAELVLNGTGSSKLLEHLSIAIDYYMENFCSDKRRMIKSVLKHPFHKIVLDHLVVDNELVIEPNEYMSLNYVDDNAFSGLTKEIDMEELFLVVGNLLDEKAAGFKFNVLHGNNFLVLKSISTQFPIFAVGSVVEDALEKNRELWLWAGIICRPVCVVLKCVVSLSASLMAFMKIELTGNKHLCSYHIDIQFVAKMNRVETVGVKTSFLAVGVFVDDTIWYILNIVSEFFIVNDISINNNKTVIIPINQGVKDATLLINSLPILIIKKGESHKYLGIFLSMKSLFKFSLAQAYKDVKFFSNVVLKKAITNKQFSYLVLVVLQLIVSYWIQFSFVSADVCHKWDVIIWKNLKAKTVLPCDFSNEILHHPSLYGLKPFEQIQSEGKLASLVFFSNTCGILGHLFEHRFLDLQFSVKLYVSSVNNFLAGVVRIFLVNELFLVNNLPSAFCGSCKFSISNILGKSLYYDSVLFLKHFGVAFGDRLLDKKDVKRLDSRGSIPYWFTLMFEFINNAIALEARSVISSDLPVLNVLDSIEFLDVCNNLLNVWSDYIKVYTDGSLKNAGSAEVTCGAMAYFLAANVSIRVRVFSLLSSTLTELQAIALALECVLASCTVTLYSDSQSAIDVCVSKTSLPLSDFHKVLSNIKADELASKTTTSSFTLSVGIQKWFLVAENTAMSGNAHHFICNIYQSICHAHWKTGSGHDVIPNIMLKKFTSRKSANLCTYLIKAVHRQLPMAVKKKLYDKNYPEILCLLYSEMELLDHVFTYSGNTVFQVEILAKAANKWTSLTDSSCSPGSNVLYLFSLCSLDIGLYAAICKGFVLRSWFIETTLVFESRKKTALALVDFVRYVIELYHIRVWFVKSKHKADMEKTGLADNDDIISDLSYCIVSLLLDGVVHMLGVIEFFAVSFGRHRLCHFFFGLDGDLYIEIDV